MQFKHPELLYALLLLLIPIIIHLFQLRKFQTVDFTNVAFLKKVTIQTRKSSQLKKWLTLLMRLLAIACLVFAFAQPFTASKTALNTEKETVLYIDNSHSMQAKGANGPLLTHGLQQLFNQASGTHKLSWLTNTETHKNVEVAEFKSKILAINYSHKQLTLDQLVLKANQLFSKSSSAEKRLIVVSDFQQKGTFPEQNDALIVDAVQLRPVSQTNISIDTAFVISQNTTSTQLRVQLSGQGTLPETAAVALYNANQLIAKTAVDFSESTQNVVTFDIENPNDFKGALRISDANLTYDNDLYFSFNTPNKIKVLTINESESRFLQRLFPQDTYDYKQQRQNSINYNDIPSQDFIVLNELIDVPASLSTSLKAFSDGGGSIVIIPSKNANINSYNNLLQALGLGVFNGSIESLEKKITKINFSHPLYENVFEKQVRNFQYPKVNSYFPLSSNATQLLGLEDGSPFLVQKGKNYLSTAAFSLENSNFINSPLIVPTFVNMALQSLPLPNLYYEMGVQNNYAVPIKLTQDDILSIKDSINSFIPLQQTKANSVEIVTVDEPELAGNYRIEKAETFIQNVSYNDPRTESNLSYVDPAQWDGATTYASVNELFETIANENKINSFWKWFVIFAIVFLLFEMIILKFLKR